MASLQQQYPGLQYTESNPKDWRIWGREFGGGSSPTDSGYAFLQLHGGELFGLKEAAFILSANVSLMDGRFTALTYVKSAGGIPYESSYITVLVRNTATYPIVLVSGTLSEGPTPFERGHLMLAPLGAIAIARSSHGNKGSDDETELVIWDRGEEERLAYRVTLDNKGVGRLYRHNVWVDAENGRILEDQDLVYQTDIAGNLTGWATPGLLPDTIINPADIFPLKDVLVTDGDGHSAYTDAGGNFLIPHSGTASTSVTASVINAKWVKVDNTQGAEETRSATVVPPGPAWLEWNPWLIADTTAQVNVVLHTTLVHDFVKAILPNFPGIDTQLLADVNVIGSCSGEYANGRMVFFRPIGDCANSAYSTVIYHEYGHYLVEKAHPKAAADYHEAIADLTSAFLVNDPELFLDLNGIDTGAVRNLNTTTVQYPSTSGDPHIRGLALGGAWWNAKKALATTLGDTAALELVRKLYLNSLFLRPPGLSPQLVVDAMVLDDDDDYVLNGTPHFTQLQSGFDSHGLTAPSLPLVYFTVSLPANLTIPDAAHSGTVSLVAGTGTPNFTTVQLHVSLNGGAYVAVPLGTSNPIAIPFDPQPCGTVAKWYLSVQTTSGSTAYYPNGGALNPVLTVFSYSTQTVFEDKFDTNLGWSVTNTAVSTGPWERGAPNGSLYGGDYSAPPTDNSLDTGTGAFVTGLGNPGDTAGAQDLDGGPTVLTSPTFDLAGANAVVSFFAWFYCSDSSDVLKCEVSDNGGSSWTTVKTFVPGDFYPNGTGKPRGWTRYQFLVGDFVAPTASVRVRFVASDNPNNSVTEAGLDTFEVTRFSCTPPTVTFQGEVTSDLFLGDITTISVEVQFRDPVTHAVVTQQVVQPNSWGKFTVDLPLGTYDVAIKGDRWLRFITPGVVVTGTGTTIFDMEEIGDTDGDNAVTLADLNEIFVNYGVAASGPDNLDGVGIVDTSDLNLVLVNFGLVGAP